MNAPRFLDHEGYGPLRPPINDDYGFEHREGQQAFIDGRGLETNDYPPYYESRPNKSHQAWKAGWMRAAQCRKRD